MGQKYEASLAFLVENISSLLDLFNIHTLQITTIQSSKQEFNLPFKQFITSNNRNKAMNVSMLKMVLFEKVVSNGL